MVGPRVREKQWPAFLERETRKTKAERESEKADAREPKSSKKFMSNSFSSQFFSARFFLFPPFCTSVRWVYISICLGVTIAHGGLLSGCWWLRSGGLSTAGAGTFSAVRAVTFSVGAREGMVL